jgi:hypothetical protein
VTGRQITQRHGSLDNGESRPKLMNDNQLLRYSRHILLDQLGVEAQEVFLRSHALLSAPVV